MLEVAHVSFSDLRGGAARAAFRLHEALNHGGVSSTMHVNSRRSSDPTVIGPDTSIRRSTVRVRGALEARTVALQRNAERGPGSLGVVPGPNSGAIRRSSAEVVNLHWINDGTLSISQIGQIVKPVVWTLHDMWAFCGTEHYTNDGPLARWRSGYPRLHDQPASSRLDLDRWAWRRKQMSWRRPMHIIAPSRWLAVCAAESALMAEWPITVIPNVVPTEIFRPSSKARARDALNLPPDAPLILFGALGGTKDRRKGWDLLQAAIRLVASECPNAQCVVAGQSKPPDEPRLGMPVIWLGHISDEVEMANVYRAVDLAAVPSRMDNLPQSGTEAQACGCPVVAFGASGLPDIVETGETGYLAEPYDVSDFARGIEWVLQDRDRHRRLSLQARRRAVELWSPDTVMGQYLTVYRSAIASTN